MLLAVLLFVSVFAAGCVGGPLDATWAQLSLIGSPQQIVFPFSDRIVLIDPLDGSPAELRDANGDIRLDEQGNPRIWQVAANSGAPIHFYSEPVLLNADTLLAAAYDRKIFEVDFPAARILNPNGIDLPGHVVAAPLLTDDLIYVPLSEGDLVALDRENYAPVWILDTGQGVWATPVLVDDTLYVTSLDHHLYALDPVTGAERWKLNLQGAIAAAPVYVDGFLYVGSFARKVFKVNESGQIVAEYPTQEWVWGPPAVVNGVVYAADLGGYVYALRDNGDAFVPLWEPRQVAQRAIRATPLVAGDSIVVGSRDHFVYWLSRETGEENFRREMRGEVLSNPLLLEPSETLNVPEPMVVISTMAREELLVGFTMDNGERRWVYGR